MMHVKLFLVIWCFFRCVKHVAATNSPTFDNGLPAMYEQMAIDVLKDNDDDSVTSMPTSKPRSSFVPPQRSNRVQAHHDSRRQQVQQPPFLPQSHQYMNPNRMHVGDNQWQPLMMHGGGPQYMQNSGLQEEEDWYRYALTLPQSQQQQYQYMNPNRMHVGDNHIRNNNKNLQWQPLMMHGDGPQYMQNLRLEEEEEEEDQYALTNMHTYMSLHTWKWEGRWKHAFNVARKDVGQLCRVLLKLMSGRKIPMLPTSRIYQSIRVYKSTELPKQKIFGWEVNVEHLCNQDNEIKPRCAIIRANRKMMIFKAITYVLRIQSSHPTWRSAKCGAKWFVEHGFPAQMMDEFQNDNIYYNILEIYPLTDENDQLEYQHAKQELSNTMLEMIQAARSSINITNCNY